LASGTWIWIFSVVGNTVLGGTSQDLIYEKLKSFFEYTEHVFRETMLSAYQPNYTPKLNEEEQKIAKALGKYLKNFNQTHEIIKLLDQKYYEVERNVNAKVLLLSTSLKMNQLLRQV
jgi:hypothetical protein